MNLSKKIIIALSLLCTSALFTGCISSSVMSDYYNESKRAKGYSNQTEDGYDTEKSEEEYQESTSQTGNEYSYIKYDIDILDDYDEYDNDYIDDVYYIVGQDITQSEMDYYSMIMALLDQYWSEDYDNARDNTGGYDYFKPILVVYKDEINLLLEGEEAVRSGCFYTSGILFVDSAQMEDVSMDSVAPIDYVMAHEYGHHIQNLLGDMDMVDKRQYKMIAKRDNVGANRLNIRLELQADYYAGRFCDYLEDLGDANDTEILSVDNIVEIIAAADSIGDDVIMGSYYSAELSDHGTADQRKRWFMNGYKDDDFKKRNIFDLNDEQL